MGNEGRWERWEYETIIITCDEAGDEYWEDRITMYLTSSKKTQSLSTYQEKDEVLDAISHWVVEGDHRMRVVVVD